MKRNRRVVCFIFHTSKRQVSTNIHVLNENSPLSSALSKPFMAAAGQNVAFQGSSSTTTQLSIAESAHALEQECQTSSTSKTRPTWLKQVYHKLSSSRQIFCLFCIFDFLFTFFLWIIYAQVKCTY